MLTCPCGATAEDTSSSRNRFYKRHGTECLKAKKAKLKSDRAEFVRQLSAGTRSVEPSTWEEHKLLQEEGDA